MFHLGVVQFLTHAGLLKNVEQICAVSGGSILAAHLGTKWSSYSLVNTFKSVASELIGAVEGGVREKVIHRLPLYYIASWLPYCGRLNATWVLQTQYNKLYKNAGLISPDPAAPDIHLLATNLTSPKSAFCFTAKQCEKHPPLQGGSTFSPGPLRLGSAVAASSAFPGLFPPLELRAKDLGVTQAELGGAQVYLTDGGVFDNLGVRALRGLHRVNPFDLMLVSDAGAKLDEMHDVSYLRSWNALPRIIDVMGERVWELENERAGSVECLCSIHATTSSPFIHPAIQRILGAVRTDLDGFSKLLIRSLICHGYEVARETLHGKVANWKAAAIKAREEAEIEALKSNDPQAVQAAQAVAASSVLQAKRWGDLQAQIGSAAPWKEPFDREPTSGVTANDVAQLLKDRRRKWKLFAFKDDLAALLAYIIVALLLGVRLSNRAKDESGILPRMW
jgi:predicted acylesterase/phospholipase RssA